MNKMQDDFVSANLSVQNLFFRQCCCFLFVEIIMQLGVRCAPVVAAARLLTSSFLFNKRHWSHQL
jgi:hypothetical protein